MNHQIGRTVFGAAVGLLVAYLSYQWITNPDGRETRALEIRVVTASREALESKLGIDNLEIVDPIAPNRKVGKVYVYPEENNWSVSGYYRRDEGDQWHPYLLSLNALLELRSLKISDDDADLNRRAPTDLMLETVP